MTNVIKKAAGFIVMLLIVNTGWGQSAAFNQNASRSNHTRVRYAIGHALSGQNNNTVRSRRGGLWDIVVLADADGDGIFETDVTDRALNGILQDDIAVIIADKAIPPSISNPLKTKHDTVKNSISNIR